MPFTTKPDQHESSWRALFALAFLALATAGAIAQTSASLPTRGKRFWAAFMQNGFGAQHVRVHVVTTGATSGTISVPLMGWSSPFSAAANSVIIVEVPTSAENTGSEVAQGKGVLIESADSVNVFISSFQNYTHESTQVLPEPSLGIAYRVDAYRGLPNFNNLHKSELLVLATADGTQVRITPSVNTAGGRPAGLPFTVNLSAGQTYQIQAAQDVLDLTGTLVEATDASGPCRPFAVFGGSMCATAPGQCSACDHVVEQCPPVNAWGTRYYTVPVIGVTSVTYRVMAHLNGTSVSIAGGAPILLNAGQTHEVSGTATPVCIDASQPVSVAQMMEGYSCAGNGDPSLFLLSPAERMSTSARWSTLGSAQINSHSVSVVVPASAVNQVLLDGNPVSAALFQPYGACADRKQAKLPVTAGTHRLQCAAGFQAYVFGLGYGESYATATHDLKAVPVQPDSTICGASTVTLTTPEPLANAQWVVLSDPGTVIATGNSFTVTPTQSESYRVSGQLPASGCPREFTYHVGIPLTIPTLLTANNQPTINVCQYEPVQLGLVPPPDPAWFNIQWWPTTSLDNAASNSPIATPLSTTWYGVSVQSPTGCGNMVDSILVSVTPGSIIDLEVSAQPSTVCAGNTSQLSSRVLRAIARDAFDTAPAAIWTAIQGGAASTACGSYTGSALYFNGNGQRSAQTLAFNTTGGGFVRFMLKIANGVPPCEDADPGDDVVLEYSTNNGINWATLSTFNEGAFPGFQQVNAVIPPIAQSANTMFRVRQLSNQGAGHDNWAIDDFILAVYDNAFASYAWSQQATLNSATAFDPVATPTVSGWYKLQATDPTAGCVYKDSVFVTVAPAFGLSVTPSTTLCSITGVQLLATPSSGSGITYTWTPNNGTLSSTSAADPVATPTETTTYAVTATNSAGCTATGQTTITVGQLFGLTVTAAQTTLCQGQSTQLTATVSGGSGLTYSWSGAGLSNVGIPNPVAAPNQTTTYTCTVSHTASGCQLSQSITITVNTGYTANAGNSLTLCTTIGHTLDVQHNVPNASYSWTPAMNLNAANIQSPTILVDGTATYSVTVSDPFGCSVSGQVTVTRAFAGVPAAQSVSACAGVPPPLTAPAIGVSYLWSTGAATPSIVPVQSGPHTVTITDGNGCQAISTFNVTLHALPVVNLGPDLSICGNAPQELNAGNAGSTYLWSTGAQTQTINATVSGTYAVAVTNANGCTANDAVTVDFSALPVDQLSDVTTCITTPPTLNAGNPGATYQWSTGATAQSIIAAVSGTYSVVVTTQQGCSATFDAQVTLAPSLSVQLGADTMLCAGSTLVLDAGNAGASYLWSNGASSQTIQVAAAGNYSVVVGNGYCTATDAVTIDVVAGPSDALQDITACVDAPPTLNAGNAGCTYLWSTGALTQTIAVNTSGTFSVIVTNAAGCASTFDAVVSLVQPPSIELGADTVLCEGQALVLDAGNPGATYAWSNGASTRTITVRTPATYTVQVSNGYCQRTDAIAVHFNPSPARMAVNEFHACLDDEPKYVVIDAGNAGSRHTWSTGETTRVIMAGAYGWYFVHMTNVYDCSTLDSARVIEYCPATIFVPNTFTPNGDGVNDVFLPVGKSIASIRMVIHDRWGELLFETDDLNVGWDGTYRGELVKNDMYVWRMEYKFYTDKDGSVGVQQTQMGHIQVLR
jgi:gliding motility-associated-like protein